MPLLAACPPAACLLQLSCRLVLPARPPHQSHTVRMHQSTKHWIRPEQVFLRVKAGLDYCYMCPGLRVAAPAGNKRACRGSWACGWTCGTAVTVTQQVGGGRASKVSAKLFANLG